MTCRIAAPSRVAPLAANGVLHFGAFQLLPGRRMLLRNDNAVQIGGRAFDLLLALASCAGEIVPHRELIDTVWPNRVVSDCNLKTQVKTLQKILGSMPDGSRYIKNVALRGYVFVAEVRTLPAGELDFARPGDDACPRGRAPDRPAGVIGPQSAGATRSPALGMA